MKKDEFFRRLQKELGELPAEERTKTTLFYQELYQDLLEDGCSEDEAVERLGDPVQIAVDIKEERDSAPLEPKTRGGKALVIILLVVGFPLWGSLVLTAALLAMVLYILLWIPVLVLGSMAIAFLFSAIGLAILSPFLMPQNLALGLVQLGGGIFLLGLSIFCVFGLVYTCRGIVKATVSFTRFITKWFRKNRRNAA